MRQLLLATLLSLLASVAYAQDRNVTFFLAKDNAWNSTEHRALMDTYGIEGATLYYKITSEENRQNPYDWIADNYLDNGHPTLVTLLIDDGGSTVGTSEGTDVSAGVPGLLSRVIRGDFDADLDLFIDAVVADGRPIVVRPFHEGNGGWYPWGMYAQGNSPELLVLALWHVVLRFEEAGADNVTFEMNLNRRGGDGVLEEAHRYIPFMNQLVDAYSISTYNRCGTSPTYDVERSFAEEFAPVYVELAQLTELPINIAEVSTSGECASRIPWFEEMLEDINARFPRIEAITFFFGEVPVGKASNTVPIEWGFSDPEERQEFNSLLNQYEEMWSAPIEPQDETRAVQPQAPVNQPRPAMAPARPQGGAAVIASPVVAPQAPPVVLNPTVPSTNPAPLQYESNFRMPWSVWGEFSFPLAESGNPALNPLSGNEFGSVGPLLRLQGTQRFLWDVGNNFEVGPGIQLGVVASNNQEQWWNNAVSAELTFGTYYDLPRNGGVDWGGLSFEVYAGRNQYLVSAPERFSGNGENVVGFRFGVNFGGDWAQ